MGLFSSAASAIGGGGIGASLSSLSGGLGGGIEDLFLGGGERKAGRLAQQGALAGRDDLLRLLGLTTEQLQPFTEIGTQAFQEQGALAGLLGEAEQARALETVTSGPQFKFLEEQGRESLIRSAVPLGQVGGSNIQKSIIDFGQNLAQQQAGQRFNQLGQLSGAGQGAIGQLIGARGGLGGGAAQFGFKGAQQRAQGDVAQNAAIRQTLQQLAGAFFGGGVG